MLLSFENYMYENETEIQSFQDTRWTRVCSDISENC